jgi:hypothetical protein
MCTDTKLPSAAVVNEVCRALYVCLVVAELKSAGENLYEIDSGRIVGFFCSARAHKICASANFKATVAKSGRIYCDSA